MVESVSQGARKQKTEVSKEPKGSKKVMKDCKVFFLVKLSRDGGVEKDYRCIDWCNGSPMGIIVHAVVKNISNLGIWRWFRES